MPKPTNPNRKLRIALNPKVDDHGYSEGTIESAGLYTRTLKAGGLRNQSEDAFESYRLVIQTDTIDANTPLTMYIWLGKVVNPEPVVTTGRGRKAVKTYNRLTTFLLATGLLQEAELEALTDDILARVEDDLEALAGKRIRFSANRPEEPDANGKTGYWNIDPASVSLI